ncbi:redoxin domain-containing protein [Cellulosimicrobium cellulans]|uniref:redoxin domain-containing protein n=1 Tax=Cellulosimicrobium cellulans TaxID=1710 RepID=UPI00130D9196|nr:redoxin domain-containing protein [Cellulosimicrobium cellulans]
MSQGPGAPVVGDAVPVLTLPDAHGSPVAVGGASAAPVLLVFVPFAFSRVCTAELGELQAHLPELDRAGVGVRAVSCDPGPALRAWAEQDGYTFPLLSDFWPHGAAARAYGVFDEVDGYARRGSFLLDATGVLRWSVESAAGVARPFAAYREAVAGL